MRVRIERRFLTTASGTRVVDDLAPEVITVEAPSLAVALIDFIANDHARLLGSIGGDDDGRATATAWKNRVYVLEATAEVH